MSSEWILPAVVPGREEGTQSDIRGRDPGIETIANCGSRALSHSSPAKSCIRYSQYKTHQKIMILTTKHSCASEPSLTPPCYCVMYGPSILEPAASVVLRHQSMRALLIATTLSSQCKREGAASFISVWEQVFLLHQTQEIYNFVCW